MPDQDQRMIIRVKPNDRWDAVQVAEDWSNIDDVLAFVEAHEGVCGDWDGTSALLVANVNQTIELRPGEWFVARRLSSIPDLTVREPMTWFFEHHDTDALLARYHMDLEVSTDG